MSPSFPPSGFSSGVQQVLSLSCSFSCCRLWCGFLIQWPKALNHSCPTTVLSHTGHCPLPLPVIVVSLLRWCSLLPLLFLSWRGKQRGAEVRRGVRDWWKDRKKKEAERESTYVKTAQRCSERQGRQPAHVHEADGVSVWGRRREGGWWGVRWERRYFSVLLRERERDREWGRDLLFMCVREGLS